MSKIQMKISPADLFTSISGYHYAFHEAMADLIDNSVDAEAVRIWVEVSREKIIIADDGCGMTTKALEDAITPWKTARKARKKKLGKFGIGMKSAGYALGQCLEIHTKASGGPFEHFKLHRSDITAADNDDHEFTTVNKETDVWHRFKLKTGTVIRISDVNKRKVTQEAIESLKHKLGLMYYGMLEDGSLKIMINNTEVEPLNPLLPDLIKGSPQNWYKVLTKETFRFPLENEPGKFCSIKLQAVHIGRASHWSANEKKKYRYFLKRDVSENDVSQKGLIRLDEQGIYIMRNGRLLTLGGWYGLASSNSLLHHNAACRILIDYDDSADAVIGLSHTKNQLHIEGDIRDKFSTCIRAAVNKSEDLFREEGHKIEDEIQRTKRQEALKIAAKTKAASASLLEQMERRRKVANPEYDRKQKDLDESLETEAKTNDNILELKERLPFNVLWSYKKNKNDEVKVIFSETHPGYQALYHEDDIDQLRRNLNLFFWTMSAYEANILEMVKDLKPDLRFEFQERFEAFRRWVSRHFVDFDESA